jgi:EAL domain-containing protein (putative c-di-GMP-specific phosphodiesterase class I)
MNPRGLHGLLSPGALSTVVQPIFELRPDGERRVGFECLTRGPANTNFEDATILFEYVRRCGEEVLVDRACITQSLQAAAPLRDEPLSVNVHAATLERDARFSLFLHRACVLSGVNPARLTLEILEHSASFDADRLTTQVRSMRQEGVKLAVDDVGVGHSNYRMILEAQPDWLKLDRYLIAGIQDDPRRQAVVQSLQQLASACGAALIAEGVESEDELGALRRLGVGFVQGNLLCPPRPVAAFAKAAGEDPS